jgi:outer membrane protein TolC
LQNQVPYNTYTTPATNVYALSFNVEGWGKRSAREKLAQAQINAISAEFTDTSNDVQTNALNAYIDALRLSLMIKSYQAALDKLKPFRGDPKLADAQTFLNTEKTKTEKDLIFASLILLNFSGDALQDPPLPLGNLNHPPQNVNVQELVEQAQNNRTEVLNLVALIEMADKNIDLTMKNRNVDISPYIGQARTPQYKYTNDVSYSLPAIGPLPAQTLVSTGTTYTAQNQITVGVTIPIPISNYLQSADIVQAANQKIQFENKLRDLKVKIRVQVMQASLKYEAAKENLIEAQKEYEAAVKKPKTDSVAAIMNVRDKEGVLLDSKTNQLKALIYLWRQSGNYAVPNL